MNIDNIQPDYDSEKEHINKIKKARYNIYNKLGFAETQIAIIEEMVKSSPSRKSGKGALKNVVTEIQSIINREPRQFESHTCEQIYGLTLEMDPTVVCYYIQIHCANVERNHNGRRHISPANIDFLVFRVDSISLVECKYESDIEKAIKKGNKDWEFINGKWTHNPYEKWANKNGLQFTAWIQNPPIATWLQNLDACFQCIGTNLGSSETIVKNKTLNAILKAPCNLSFLKNTIDNFTSKIALWLIANGKCFAALRTSSFDCPEQFVLFPTKAQADLLENTDFAVQRKKISQPNISSPLLLASKTDIEFTEKRLMRLERINNNLEPKTIRMTELAAKLSKAAMNGVSNLEAALSSFSKCGNKENRLNIVQDKILKLVLKRYWHTNKVKRKNELWFELNALCKNNNVDTPSKSFLNKHLKKLDPQIRALATSGMRGYQAISPRSESTTRSKPALRYGSTLHIDSSKLDIKCAPNLIDNIPADSPVFYIGVDSASGFIMSHALIFGSPRTDGLAIILRRFVEKHGFLPSKIFLDRGVENISNWFKKFTRENGISVCHTPTAASKFNSPAESNIKQINDQVSHKLPGSTDPDKAGRKVDGKFKSSKTAALSFLEVSNHFNHFLYNDSPCIPDDLGERPIDKKNALIQEFGIGGKECLFDDNLLIMTSINIPLYKNMNEREGIRTGDDYFTSSGLQLALRTNKVTEIRSDCIDPSVMYCKVGERWFKAFGKRTTSYLQMSDDELLFHKMYRPIVNKYKRKEKEVLSEARYNRLKSAERTRLDNSGMEPSKEEHNQPEAKPNSVTDELSSFQVTGYIWGEIPLLGKNNHE